MYYYYYLRNHKINSEALFKNIFSEAGNVVRNTDLADVHPLEALIHVCSFTLRLANCCMSTLLPPHTITTRGPRRAGRRAGKETRHQDQLLSATAKIFFFASLSFSVHGNMERTLSLRKLSVCEEKDKSSTFHFNLTSCFSR